MFCSDVTTKRENIIHSNRLGSDFAVLNLVVQPLILGIAMWNRQDSVKSRIKQNQNKAGMFQIQPYSLWDKQGLDLIHEMHPK